MISKIFVVAGILYNNNNNFYIFKRANTLPLYPNFFEFAGGKVEPGETNKLALKRELNEELSININEENIIGFENNIVENEKYVVTFYKIYKWDNTIKLNKNIHSEFLIINKNDIKNIKNLLETNKIVSNYL